MAKTSVGDVARETGTEVCWTPEGGLLLEGRIIGRTNRSVRVGEVEHTVYSYRVLAGAEHLLARSLGRKADRRRHHDQEGSRSEGLLGKGRRLVPSCARQGGAK